MPSTTPLSTTNPAAAGEAVCRLLDWDSQFFGLKIGRVNSPRLSGETMPQLLQWCARQHLNCLYFLADADDPQTSRLALAHGFQLVDIRLTLELGAAPVPGPCPTGIRPFRPADLPQLKQLAQHLHEDSRFFFDSRFPIARSRELYSIWLERSCLDPKGRVFVVDSASGPAGYIACAINEQQEGRVELIGVASTAQGRGAGRNLVAAGLRWLAEQQVRRVTVVTQGRNVRAQRLYQRAGFVTHTLQLWYHLWFPAPPGAGGEV